jgi:predicted dehydrogenase
MIDAAIVGLGRWGQTLVKAVAGKSDRLRFTCAVSRDPLRHRDFAAAHALDFADRLNAALERKDLRAIVLATPHSQHVSQIVAVAGAGKAVFCEKPLALTKADALRAVGACKRAGVVLGIGTDKRFFASMQDLFRRVERGELGPLLHLEAHFSNELTPLLASPWRHRTEEAPAGGLTQTGVHALDALLHLGGPTRRVAAQFLSQKPPPDAFDSLSVMIEFACGASGLLAVVRSTPAFWRVHAFGRAASAEALGRNHIVLRKSGRGPECLALPPVDSVRANLEAFADAVEGRAPYPIPHQEMLDTVAAFEAVTKAVESGRYETVA